MKIYQDLEDVPSSTLTGMSIAQNIYILEKTWLQTIDGPNFHLSNKSKFLKIHIYVGCLGGVVS